MSGWASLARDQQQKGGNGRAPLRLLFEWSYRFLAVDFLRAVDFLAGDFLAVDLRLVDLRAVPLRAVDFLAGDFLAVDLRLVDLRAVPLRAVDFLAVDFLRVDAAFRVPADRFAAVFLPAVFLAVDFFRAVAMTHPLSAGQDAMRFRRRRSRSLIPPHTPYRSSRRNA